MTLKLGFIGIVTNDMAASLAFYRALGVRIDPGQDDVMRRSFTGHYRCLVTTRLT
jgi:catechol 2,3-dioxygenase-like lactoylglutathione lyase family enzyme